MRELPDNFAFKLAPAMKPDHVWRIIEYARKYDPHALDLKFQEQAVFNLIGGQ